MDLCSWGPRDEVKVLFWVEPSQLFSQIRIMCQSKQNSDCITMTNRTEKLGRKQRDGPRSTIRTNSPPATAPLTLPTLTSRSKSSSTRLVIRWRKNLGRIVTRRSTWRAFRRRREGRILTLQSLRRRRSGVRRSRAVCPGGKLEMRRVPWQWPPLKSPGTKSSPLLPPTATRRLVALSFLANPNTQDLWLGIGRGMLLKYARPSKFVPFTNLPFSWAIHNLFLWSLFEIVGNATVTCLTLHGPLIDTKKRWLCTS